MRKCIGLLTLALSLVTLTVAAQSPDPLLGTWKASPARVTQAAGVLPAQSNISVWEALGNGQFKNTIDSVNAKGEANHNEIITKFDGADAPVKGAVVPNTTRAYRRLDGRTTGSPAIWEYVTKVNGKVTTTYRSINSADNKMRVTATTGINAQGQPVSSIGVYEKQ